MDRIRLNARSGWIFEWRKEVFLLNGLGGYCSLTVMGMRLYRSGAADGALKAPTVSI